MRFIERIPVITELMTDELKLKFLQYQYGVPSNAGNVVIKTNEEKIQVMLDNWKGSEDDLLKEWLANPDLRLIQLLINNNITSHWCNFYEAEETDWLIVKGVPAEDVLFYKVTFSITDGVVLKLKQPVIKLLKDIDKDVIKRLLILFDEGKIDITRTFKNTLQKLNDEI